MHCLDSTELSYLNLFGLPSGRKCEHLINDVGSIESSENSANVTEFYDEDKSSTEVISVIAAEGSSTKEINVTESYGSLTEGINVIAAEPSDGNSTKEANVTEPHDEDKLSTVTNVIVFEPSDERESSTKETELSDSDESSTKRTNRPFNERFKWTKEALDCLFFYLKKHKETAITLALARKKPLKNELWVGASAMLFHNVPRGHEYRYERCWVKWKNVLNNYRSDVRKGKNPIRYKSEVEEIIGSPKISGNKRPGNNEHRSNK